MAMTRLVQNTEGSMHRSIFCPNLAPLCLCPHCVPPLVLQTEFPVVPLENIPEHCVFAFPSLWSPDSQC